MNDKKNKLWLEAQKHEKEYYDTNENLQWGVPHSLSYWKKFLRIESLGNFGVEIGCGPNGLYNFTDKVVGIDPINYHKRNLINGVGEYLPFDSVDYTICCNGIDHFQSPQTALDEMFRISKVVILWVYIHPKIVSLVLGLFDKKHPFHFTKEQLKNFLKKYKFKVLQKFTVTPIESHWKHARTITAKTKLLFGWLLGVRGYCIHMEVKNE